MKTFFRFFIPCFLCFLLLPLIAAITGAQVGTTGKFQILYAVPNPVNAGEKVVFNITILNQDVEAWPRESYYLDADIYDSGKEFAGKTEKIIGDSDVKPGGTARIEINFLVPPKYSGVYYYRVFLIQKGKRIAESDLQEFNVTGIQGKTALWKPSWLKFNGQMTLSLRNTDRNNWRNFIGNASFNGATNIFNGKTQISFDSFLTSKSTSSETQISNVENKIYNLLLKNVGKNYVFAIGDLVPNFSQLSLYGAGMRGAYFNVNSEKNISEIVLTRVSEPQEPANGIPGIYERWVWGVRTRNNTLPGMYLGANFVGGEDRFNSISFSTANAAPHRGKVYGLTAGYKSPVKNGSIEVFSEFMLSDLNPDIQSVTEKNIFDYAYRIELSRSTEKNKTLLWYLDTQPGFKAIGSPGIQSDRKMFDISESIALTKKMDLGGGFNQWTNNVLNEPSQLTTTQKTYRLNTKYRFEKPLPALSVVYSFNTATANELSKQNNFNSDIGFTLAGANGKTYWSAGLQQINFTDETALADNFSTIRTAFNARLPLSARVTADAGLNLTKTENLTKNFPNLLQSFSSSIFWNIAPSKFSAQFWVTYTTEKNNAPLVADRIDYFKTDTVTEFSFAVNPGLRLIIGGIMNVKTDNITGSNNFSEKGVTTRVIVNF